MSIALSDNSNNRNSARIQIIKHYINGTPIFL